MSNRDAVTTESPPSPGRNWPRYLWQLTGFCVVLLLVVGAILLVLLLTLGRGAHTVAPRLVRLWGRTMLWVCGVELHIEAPALAEVVQKRQRVMTFNHASTMDLFVCTALWPDGCVAVVKREILWVPIMGQAIYFLGFIPIDRRNRQRATASLSAAAQVIADKHLTVMIAPEGTRAKSAELLPFKHGAFHLAAQADVPIVPMCLHGTHELWPMGQADCHPGVVTVRVLPELPSGHGDTGHEAITRRADALRDEYMQTLVLMRQTVPVTKR